MVKQRMTTADVAGEVACLRQRVLGMRVANLYDLNSKVNRRRFCYKADALLLMWVVMQETPKHGSMIFFEDLYQNTWCLPPISAATFQPF